LVYLNTVSERIQKNSERIQKNLFSGFFCFLEVNSKQLSPIDGYDRLSMNNDQTFPRSARLTSPEEFKTVFKKAHKLNFKEFTVYVLQNNRIESRLGLAISKKTVKKAVSRNLIKRIIRDSFRLRRKKLKGWDIVFVSRFAAPQMSKSKLEVLTAKVWKRLES